jgi:hypothetical protein
MVDNPEAAAAQADPIPETAGTTEPEDEAPSPEPVVLADAMCGAFCSLKGEARQA